MTSSEQVAPAFADGKISIFIGMEGSHMLGNSLGVLRMYHRLGIRYLTLTHVCSTSAFWPFLLPPPYAHFHPFPLFFLQALPAPTEEASVRTAQD